jgi:hypothetical protein
VRILVRFATRFKLTHYRWLPPTQTEQSTSAGRTGVGDPPNPTRSAFRDRWPAFNGSTNADNVVWGGLNRSPRRTLCCR